MAPAMQPAEIQFAQRLASHEKGIRDRAVKKLRQYISVKTQRETGGRPAVRRAHGGGGWGAPAGPGRAGRGAGPGEPPAERGGRAAPIRTPACVSVSASCRISPGSTVEGLRPTGLGGLPKVTASGEAEN